MQDLDGTFQADELHCVERKQAAAVAVLWVFLNVLCVFSIPSSTATASTMLARWDSWAWRLSRSALPWWSGRSNVEVNLDLGSLRTKWRTRAV
jgi:hypothetical protein